MVKILNENMTKAELVEAVMETYGDPSNWERFEKDTGAGLAEISPWAIRDRGNFSRKASDLYYRHPEKSKNDLIAKNIRELIAQVDKEEITAEQAFHRMKGVANHYADPVDERDDK